MPFSRENLSRENGESQALLEGLGLGVRFLDRSEQGEPCELLGHSVLAHDLRELGTGDFRTTRIVGDTTPRTAVAVDTTVVLGVKGVRAIVRVSLLGRTRERHGGIDCDGLGFAVCVHANSLARAYLSQQVPYGRGLGTMMFR